MKRRGPAQPAAPAAGASPARPAGPGLDLPLLAIVLILTGVGLLAVLTASAATAQMDLHNSLFFFQRQALWASMGLFALAAGAMLNLTTLRRLSVPLLVLTTILLFLTHVPGIGVSELGAARWLRVGPISLQPSEVAKLAVCLYGADILARLGPAGWKLPDLRKAVVPLIAVMGLVLTQPDLGSTLVLGAATFALFWCNGTPGLLMGGMGLGGAAAIVCGSLAVPYMRARWMGFLDPWGDAQGKGFQLVQSLLAFGSGGLFGTGFGQGKQKLFWLPIQYTDFIFAVMAEELGFFGAVGILALFVLLAWRGYRIAMASHEPFQGLLAVGLTTVVTIQALINLGVVSASVPTTGIPLPFLSFGGTSLLATLFSMGLVLNVSRRNAQRARLAGLPGGKAE